MANELKLSQVQPAAVQDDQATPRPDSGRRAPDPGAYLPEQSRSERYLALAIFLLSFLYLCIFRRYSWIDPDEGIILQGAQRILDGQVLYRDFFSFFTPGSYYLFALVFRVFGDSYLVAHTAIAFFGAILSPITYLLARRVCSRQASLLVTGLMTITALPWRFVVIHNWDSTLWACLALYCAVRLLESPNVKWAFAAASFVSLTALFEQSKGAGLLLGLGTGLLIIVVGSQPSKLFTRDRLIAIMLGLAWPFFVTVVYFASRHALTTMLASWFWPLQHYSVANRVPYAYDNLTGETRHRIFGTASPGLRLFAMLVFSARSWVPFLPLFGVALLIRLAFRRWRQIPLGPEWGYYVLVSATISGLLLSIVIARSDYLHFIYLQPVFFLALAWLLDGRGIRSRFFTRIAPVVGFCLSMSLLAMAAQVLFQARGDNRVVTRRGTLTMQTKDAVIEYVQAHVPPGERILIYPYQPTYYYLTQTYSPTRFDFYQPGMHTDQQLQEMLADFSAHPTPVVLYEPAFANHIHEAWPNTPPGAFAHDAMADYILREYRGCITLSSQILLMARSDLGCPNGERPSS
jgi:4-amino-4-deoxy-L-arabinose transferase-like glycosyltransferase